MSGDRSSRVCLQNTSAAIAHLDKDRRIIFANTALAALAGEKAGALVGRRLSDVFSVRTEKSKPLPGPDQTRAGELITLKTGGSASVSVVGNLVPCGAQKYVLTLFPASDTQRTLAKGEAPYDGRDEFLAVLEHELRNPLTPILAWTEVLKQDPNLTAQMNYAVQSIEKSVLQQRALVEDLLDLASIRSGRTLCEQYPVRIHDVLLNVICAMKPKAARKKAGLVFDSSSCDVLVLGDRARLEQIFTHLIDNAIRFTPPDTQIRVQLSCTETWAGVDVVDAGGGIPQELINEIFKPFLLTHPLSSLHRGGLGLGLALVKDLTEQHGGRVEVLPMGLSDGAHFKIWLPTLPALKSPSSKPKSVLAECGRKVLIVEDRDDAREAIRMLLESWDIEIAEAADGESGITLMASFKPDLILCDLSMPVMDGWSMAREIRSHYPENTTPIIAMSGHGTPADVRHSLQCGFQAHLVKPCEAGVLLSVLSKYLPVRVK